MSKRIFLQLFLIVGISVTGFCQSNNFEISKNMEIYTSVYKTLFENYVDELNTGELMRTGIDAMLESLDPYTEYKSESEVEDFRFMTTGQYGGIGALILQHGEDVIISEPYQGTAADKAGLKAGDKIIAIDGKNVSDKSSSNVSELMKGEPGTELAITVERFGENKAITKKIIREKVSIPSVPYYELLDDSIAYINLSGFTFDASSDFLNAYNSMRKNGELSGLIIDLRSNGGGLLEQAVKIMNFFVPANELIVNTKGRIASKNSYHKTTVKPIDTLIPIVVLVNGASASASEILAGAMQDLDRGVIVGQRTFGKGLVQNILPIAYNSQMKVTVAKYYIPSGRCIQAIDYSHKDAYGNWNKVPDSLMTKFYTRNKRTVWDGAGIQPDIEVAPVEYGEVTANLIMRHYIFDFATQYYYNNIDKTVDAKTFVVDDTIWNDFVNYLEDKNFTYNSYIDDQLVALKKNVSENEHYSSVLDEIDKLELALKEVKSKDLITYKEAIIYFLGNEIVSRYCYNTGKLIYFLNNDKELEAAVQVINDKNKYNSILAGK